MRKWFKYGLAFLALLFVVAFFNRERLTNYPSSTPPKNPEKVLPPYNDILYTEGGDDVSPSSVDIGNDLPMANA